MESTFFRVVAGGNAGYYRDYYERRWAPIPCEKFRDKENPVEKETFQRLIVRDSSLIVDRF